MLQFVILTLILKIVRTPIGSHFSQKSLPKIISRSYMRGVKSWTLGLQKTHRRRHLRILSPWQLLFYLSRSSITKSFINFDRAVLEKHRKEGVPLTKLTNITIIILTTDQLSIITHVHPYIKNNYSDSASHRNTIAQANETVRRLKLFFYYNRIF